VFESLNIPAIAIFLHLPYDLLGTKGERWQGFPGHNRSVHKKIYRMILKRPTNWISSVIMIMVLMVGTNVQATSDFQIWIPININAKLTEQLRGFLELQPRIGDNASNLTSAIVRPAFGWAINKQATL
jgi:hypothetical protein